MKRALVPIAVAALLGALPGAAVAAEDALTLTPLPSSDPFPTRSYLLTLPQREDVGERAIEVTENGEPVRDLKLKSGAIAGSAVVLAIDASNSMRGRPIVDAMEAARAFAARRRPDQRLGVVFFNDEVHVALEPTTDSARIDETVAALPELAKQTRLNDGAMAAIDLLDAIDAPVGAVVILSDGADSGSTSQPADVVEAATDKRVRMYAVGLRSKRFSSFGLQALAENGVYSEAASSEKLQPIFAELGRRLSNEYLISYRSEAPLDSRVAVTVTVEGFKRAGVAAYETPRLDVKVFDPSRASKSTWARPGVLIGTASLIALLLGGVLFLLLRPRQKSVSERVEGFAGVAVVDPGIERSAPPASLLSTLDLRLSRHQRWQRFKLDLELARIRTPATTVVLTTATTTLLLAWVLIVVAGRPVTGVCTLLIPVGVRMYARMRAARVERAFAEQLPDNLQVLASALRAGHSFTGALSVMCEDAAEPSRAEYSRVILDDQLGLSIEESMKIVAKRMSNADVGYIGLIATIQRESGGNTAEVLDRVTATVRERAQLRRLVRTLTAQGRIGAWIVTLLPVGLIAFLTLVQPDYLQPMVESPTGRIVIGVGLAFLLTGAAVLRRIVDIKV